MRVLIAASEVTPYAKTGGLGDVIGALPDALAAEGLDVAVVMPLYPSVRRALPDAEVIARHVACPFGNSDRPFDLRRATLPGEHEVPLYLVENPSMFELEEGYYGSEKGAQGDGHLRFLWFGRAILRVPHAAGFYPDVFHCNDWPTGLVAPLLRTVMRNDPDLDRAAVVTTIHNLAYQGVYPVDMIREAGVPEYLIHDGRLLEKDLGNLLAGGLRFSDAITTVSARYAEEILTPEFGQGLEGLLDWRRDLLSGIVNGLDLVEWNPADDQHLEQGYDIDDLSGKAHAKERLLEDCGLHPTEGPVFGTVARLTEQKGLDLLPPMMERLLGRRDDARFVLLGSGDPSLEDAFRRLESRFPGRAHARIGFDVPFSHRVEAGCDFFLMPSRFEPCGLNQMISMRYGTPPIVHAVGGLADTVVDATEETIADGTATGFHFRGDDVDKLAHAVGRALDAWDTQDSYESIRRAGMKRDFGWSVSASRYLETYERAIEQRKDGSHLAPLLSDLPREPLEVDLPPLPPLPTWYPRDGLSLMAVAPRRVLAQWEISGDKSASLILTLDEVARGGLGLRLMVRERGGTDLTREVGGHQREDFVDLPHGGDWRAELWLVRPDRGDELLLEHDFITVPDVSEAP